MFVHNMLLYVTLMFGVIYTGMKRKNWCCGF